MIGQRDTASTFRAVSTLLSLHVGDSKTRLFTHPHPLILLLLPPSPPSPDFIFHFSPPLFTHTSQRGASTPVPPLPSPSISTILRPPCFSTSFHDSHGCCMLPFPGTSFPSNITPITLSYICLVVQPVDFDGDVNLFHFVLLRCVGKGAFGKVPPNFLLPLSHFSVSIVLFQVRVVQHKQGRELYALKYINKSKCVKMKAIANIIQERRLLEEVRLVLLPLVTFRASCIRSSTTLLRLITPSSSTCATLSRTMRTVSLC